MSERPIILKSAKKPDSMGMIMDFFVVSSENLEFVGWHSGALPWSFSFLVEDWSFSLNIWTWFFLQIDDEARFLASSTYPLLPPTSLLFCWVLTESKKKYNLFYKREFIAETESKVLEREKSKEDRPEDIWSPWIDLKETLGRFWKSKRNSLKDFFDFGRKLSVCRSQFVK